MSPATLQLAPREVRVKGGGLLLLASNGEGVQASLYTIGTGPDGPQVERATTSASDLDLALRAVCKQAHRPKLAPELLLYVRATGWGAGLP